MTEFKLNMGDTSAERLADALEHIADLIRQGYTSGYPGHGGYWQADGMVDVPEDSEA